MEYLFSSVAADIESFLTWGRSSQAPPEAELRRGTLALYRLLNLGQLLSAWCYYFPKYGLRKQPIVFGPDAEAIAAHEGLQLENSIYLIAGGGRIGGVELALVGGFRMPTPPTGKRPADQEGFAVMVNSITRDARQPPLPGPLDRLVWRRLPLSRYLEGTAAYCHGSRISRKELISFAANRACDEDPSLEALRPPFGYSSADAAAQLKGRVGVLTMEGIDFEIFSIGQALGRSPHMLKLASRIRENRAPPASKDEPEKSCPQCGHPYYQMRVEYAVVQSPENDILGISRTFYGYCPVHGPFNRRVPGHHSTMGAAQMKKRFNKRCRTEILARLPPGESESFGLALKGRRTPTEAEIARWTSLSTP